MFINFHLSSVGQWVSLFFYESYSYLMIFFANTSDIKTMKRSVFVQFWYGEFNGAICVLMSTNACSSTLIFSVLISVFPWFFMEVLVTWWFLVPTWVTLKFIHFLYGEFNGVFFNEHQCMFINFHLFSVDQCVS